MDRQRQMELISAINKNVDIKELNLMGEEKEFYESMLAEKEEFKRKYNKNLVFELPMESYNNLW